MEGVALKTAVFSLLIQPWRTSSQYSIFNYNYFSTCLRQLQLLELHPPPLHQLLLSSTGSTSSSSSTTMATWTSLELAVRPSPTWGFMAPPLQRGNFRLVTLCPPVFLDSTTSQGLRVTGGAALACLGHRVSGFLSSRFDTRTLVFLCATPSSPGTPHHRRGLVFSTSLLHHLCSLRFTPRSSLNWRCGARPLRTSDFLSSRLDTPPLVFLCATPSVSSEGTCLLHQSSTSSTFSSLLRPLHPLSFTCTPASVPVPAQPGGTGGGGPGQHLLHNQLQLRRQPHGAPATWLPFYGLLPVRCLLSVSFLQDYGTTKC